MRYQKSLIIGGFFLLVSWVNLSEAQGFQVNFQGQKQQGMGCAGSALIQDASTLFFNPAGAAFVAKSQVNLAVTPIFGNVMYVDSSTNEVYRTENPVGTPLNVYALIKSKRFHRLAYGLSVTTPFGSTVQYEPGWIGRFAITRLSMKVFHIQPTASFKITDNISIGAGFVLSPGSVNLQKDLPVQFNDGAFGHAEISGAAMGYGYNLGVYYNPGGFLSAGLSHRSGINMSVSDGQVAFTVPDGLTTSFPNGTLSASLALPSVTTLGLSIKPNASWNIVADINYVGWNTYDTLAFDYATNTSSLVDTKSPRMYQNIFAFRGGAQYTVFAKDKVLNVRFGGGFGFSPVPTGYLTPETPDGNRAYLTSGISYEFNKRFSFDASIYATKVTRADTNLETQLSGTFTTIAWAPGIGINYNW